jgi:hypothetical protein
VVNGIKTVVIRRINRKKDFVRVSDNPIGAYWISTSVPKI